MDNCQSRTNDAYLFLVGAGLGIGLGILLAPKSGRETREAIRGKVNESQEYLARQSRDLKVKASNLGDRASGLLHQGKDTVAAAVDAGREAYRDTVSPGV